MTSTTLSQHSAIAIRGVSVAESPLSQCDVLGLYPDMQRPGCQIKSGNIPQLHLGSI
ncbi:MAG: hypothetical protein AAGN15_14180 [Cyanobacteria bacterium J06581_3]